MIGLKVSKENIAGVVQDVITFKRNINGRYVYFKRVGQFSGKDTFYGKQYYSNENGDLLDLLYSDSVFQNYNIVRGTHLENGNILYIGEFQNDLYHGRGCEYSSYGIIRYEGEFYMGLYHGKGILTRGDTTYEGNFERGELHGFVRETVKVYEGLPTIIEGNWCRGERNGFKMVDYGFENLYLGGQDLAEVEDEEIQSFLRDLGDKRMEEIVGFFANQALYYKEKLDRILRAVHS